MKLAALCVCAAFAAATPCSEFAPQDEPKPAPPKEVRAGAGPQAPASRPAAKPEDVATPEALAAALYDVISGPAGAPRDWDRFRSLFHHGARMIALRPGANGLFPVEMTPEDYVRRSGPWLEREGFFEREIAARRETFGGVAHVFSTYESRKTPDGDVFARGVNTIQMIRAGGRWAVLSLAWDEERPGQPLPDAYLPKK